MKTGELVIDAFGVIRPAPAEALKCDDRYLTEYDYELNKETGVFEVVESGKVDLVELIQSQKDNCGLNLALLNISRGTNPDIYADDGKHGGDTTLVKTNINEAYRQAIESEEVAQKIAKELGIDDYKNCTDIEKVVAAAIEKKLNPVKEASAPGTAAVMEEK